jgi:hypothetical protein
MNATATRQDRHQYHGRTNGLVTVYCPRAA